MFRNQHSGEKKSRLLVVLAGAGFFLGILFMNLGKKALLENTGLLSEYTLYEMKYSTVDGSAFFFYVLQRRVGAALVLAVLSTTWLGLAATFTCAVWLGVSFGMLVMASLLQYGLKGILLIFVGIFPQVILYLPATFRLLAWSYEFCLAMYFPHRLPQGTLGMSDANDKGSVMRKKGLQFLCLLGVVIMGCLLESYVNPGLVSNLLKIF